MDAQSDFDKNKFTKKPVKWNQSYLKYALSGQHLYASKGKVKQAQLPCEQFLQHFEISHAFFPPVSHGEKRGKIQNFVEIAHKEVAVVLILLSL